MEELGGMFWGAGTARPEAATLNLGVLQANLACRNPAWDGYFRLPPRGQCSRGQRSAAGVQAFWLFASDFSATRQFCRIWQVLDSRLVGQVS